MSFVWINVCPNASIIKEIEDTHFFIKNLSIRTKVLESKSVAAGVKVSLNIVQ